MSLFQLLAGPADLPKKVSRVIKDGDIDVNDTWEDGYLPLMVAAQNGLVNSARKLIGLGADVNAVADDGDTALMEAANENHDEVVSLLIEAGADMDTTDDDDMTALMYACTAGNIEATSVLIKAGANYRIADQDGKTALDMAVENKHWDVAEVLSDLGVKSGTGRTNTKNEKEDQNEEEDEDEADDSEDSDEEEEEDDSSDEESDNDPEETWLTPILVEAGIPEHMMYHAEEMLVRQEGIGSQTTLAHLSPTLFHRAYLEKLDIKGLGMQQVLLDLHAGLHEWFLTNRFPDILRDMCVLPYGFAVTPLSVPPTRPGQAVKSVPFPSVMPTAELPSASRKACFEFIARAYEPVADTPSTAVRTPVSFSGPKTDMQILYNTATVPAPSQPNSDSSTIGTTEKAQDTHRNSPDARNTTARAPLTVETAETSETGQKRAHSAEESASKDFAAKRATPSRPSLPSPAFGCSLGGLGLKSLPTMSERLVNTDATGKPATTTKAAEKVAPRAAPSAEKKVLEVVVDSNSDSDCCSDAEYVIAKESYSDDDDDVVIVSG